jgi:peroxiredoxin (alkyl hydroperoxide reductase subunit C)
MKAYQQNLQKLEAANTQVLGISMDSPFSNKAWAEKIGVTFPLLSDWGGDLTKKLGIFNPKYKAARRTTLRLDENGKIEQIITDKDAIDPSEVVTACERKSHKSS